MPTASDGTGSSIMQIDVSIVGDEESDQRKQGALDGERMARYEVNDVQDGESMRRYEVNDVS